MLALFMLIPLILLHCCYCRRGKYKNITFLRQQVGCNKYFFQGTIGVGVSLELD